MPRHAKIARQSRLSTEFFSHFFLFLATKFSKYIDNYVVVSGGVSNLVNDVLQPFFVERVFQIFDKDDSGSISFQEFIDAMHQFAGQTPDDKIKFLFKVYDIDGKIMICYV